MGYLSTVLCCSELNIRRTKLNDRSVVHGRVFDACYGHVAPYLSETPYALELDTSSRTCVHANRRTDENNPMGYVGLFRINSEYQTAKRKFDCNYMIANHKQDCKYTM